MLNWFRDLSGVVKYFIISTLIAGITYFPAIYLLPNFSIGWQNYSSSGNFLLVLSIVDSFVIVLNCILIIFLVVSKLIKKLIKKITK